MRQGLIFLVVVLIVGLKPIQMFSQTRQLTRSLRLVRSKSAQALSFPQSRVFQSRCYYRPRYLSSSSLLAEWCYGSFDENGMDRFGSPAYGEDKKGAQKNNLKSVSPLTIAAFDDAMPEPRLTSNSDNYGTYVGDGNGGGGGMDLGFTEAELALVAARAEAEAASTVVAQKSSESEAWEDLGKLDNEMNGAVAAEQEIVEPPSGGLEGEGVVSLEMGKVALREEMREWRKLYSEEHQVPVYTVFSNKVLDGILEHLPTTDEELRSLPGVGEKTLMKIRGKVLPLVKMVLAGKPLENNALEETEGGSAGLSSSSSKDMARKRRDARMSAILASLETQHTINVEDLNEEQVDAADAILGGRNTFITGSAGTGKSFLLRYLVQEFRAKHGDRAVAVTASTGIAAINLGGQTIHSFAGIGLATGTGDISKVISKVKKNMRAVKRWQDLEVLIIDEISMIDRPLFELLDKVGREIRRNHDRPFGGIQVVVVGDFLQLPPVPSKYTKTREFCFESPVWNDLGLGFTDEYGYIHSDNINTIILNEVVRQNDDNFSGLLNDVRVGELSDNQLNILNSCVISHKPPPTDGILPTKLYSINKDVDNENLDRLMELPGDVVEVKATDVWQELPSVSSMKRTITDNVNRAIPDSIRLKVGAQVMLLRNRSNNPDDSSSAGRSLGLVNGSRGVITGFVRSSSASGGLVPRVCFDNGQEVIVGPAEYFSSGPGGDGQLVRSQVPLKLAWAITIHKSQGSTLSRAELMLSNTFDYGQAYVALSRVTSIEGLWLTEPLMRSNVRANPLVLDYFGSQAARGIRPVE